jgi:AcrR family transcriptional regulator
VSSTKTERRRRADGERSRAAILAASAQLATVEGLDGLSIARLAEHVGMSKSGLFAHFGSKEELQLATVEAAYEVFAGAIVSPAAGAGTPLERLELLCEGFLRHVERRDFIGGCFFASAASELALREGPVRARVLTILGDWRSLLEAQVREAQEVGQLSREDDPRQLSFELNAFMMLANVQYVVSDGDAAVLDRARKAIARRLELARS